MRDLPVNGVGHTLPGTKMLSAFMLKSAGKSMNLWSSVTFVCFCK